MRAEDVKSLIESGLPDARATVSGDGDHFEAVVVCAAFEGRKLLEQHRMVYATLGERMHNEIHALSMRTFTPDQWAASGRASV